MGSDLLAAVMTTGHGGLNRIAENLYVDQLIEQRGQEQTIEAFSRKWGSYDGQSKIIERMTTVQQAWYLQLYGFESEDALARYLADQRFVIDCGTGTGNKAAWFAQLSPNSTVIGVDISHSVGEAARRYAHIPNLIYIRGDIGALPFFADGRFDYVNCDQVIHHTAKPRETFRELTRLTRPGKDLTCYVYRKKALPRELLDEHFREHCKTLNHEELMQLSRELTDLGKMLSDLPGEIDFPAVPSLGIEGGKMSIQRFIYWNFMKCYWNAEVGHDNSVMTNYDWYAPSKADRYTEAEFRSWFEAHGLKVVHFHKESACYSGRFRKPLEKVGA